MAEKVTSMPKRRYGTTKYPWDEWLDGSVWQIGKADYDCSPASFRTMVYGAAKLRETRVSVVYDKDVIYVQAHD